MLPGRRREIPARDGAAGERAGGGGAIPDAPADGDDDAAYHRFVALAPEHLPTMLRVAAALVGVADAEDAAQEALIRAWQAWGSLRDTSALRPWLLRITVNVCRDWSRGRFGSDRRRTQPLLDADEDDTLARLDFDPGASDHTGALDLRAAVNALDADLRAVVALRYYVGMDATEIGAALGIPPATARTRLRRALTLLRDRLGAQTAPGSQPPARSADRPDAHADAYSNPLANPLANGRLHEPRPLQTPTGAPFTPKERR